MDGDGKSSIGSQMYMVIWRIGGSHEALMEAMFILETGSDLDPNPLSKNIYISIQYIYMRSETLTLYVTIAS